MDGSNISLCLLALHTTSSASTCYAFRCSQRRASALHRSSAHKSTHVWNAMCQCIHPEWYTLSPVRKSALICYHIQETSRGLYNTDLAVDFTLRGKDLLSVGVQNNSSFHFNRTALSQRFRKKREREEQKISDKQGAEKGFYR